MQDCWVVSKVYIVLVNNDTLTRVQSFGPLQVASSWSLKLAVIESEGRADVIVAIGGGPACPGHAIAVIGEDQRS
jgi:hypothetical protein